MRYFELLEDSPTDIGRSDLIDQIVSLKSQGINSVTLNQLIQSLQNDSRLKDINIDRSFIEDLISDMDGVDIQPNSEGVLSLTFDQEKTSAKSSDTSKVDDMAKNASMNFIKGK